MIYKRGDYGISVEQIDGFGKNPGLWIRHDNVWIKVASFGNKRKADKFIEYLEWMLLVNSKPPKEDGDA